MKLLPKISFMPLCVVILIFLRVPEAASLSHATSFNKHNGSMFFQNLQYLYAWYSFEAQDVWNLDEMGITTVYKPKKNIACSKGLIMFWLHHSLIIKYGKSKMLNWVMFIILKTYCWYVLFLIIIEYKVLKPDCLEFELFF